MDPCHPETVRVAASHQAEAEKIAAELAAIASSGMVLPGSMTQRRTRCGRRNCGCHADPPRLHGPYWQWTRKVAAKTICRWLSADQHQDYQPWMDNDRRLRELLARLEALGAAALEADPRWERQTPRTDVGTARLTRGRPPNPAANNQLRAKREDLTVQRHKFEHHDNLARTEARAPDLRRCSGIPDLVTGTRPESRHRRRTGLLRRIR
jgi:hypothetical protein